MHKILQEASDSDRLEKKQTDSHMCYSEQEMLIDRRAKRVCLSQIDCMYEM